MMTDDSELNPLRGDAGEIDGAILSMHIRNFFCHNNLEIKFNKRINFIVGRNGSGKSAILTALVVGLGCRAAVTNRGASLSEFVKKGTNAAHIEIKIKNSSRNSYKHDLYGDVITIVRTLNASGGSSYKIKNECGNVVSTKYDDVAMICSVHDIQVDNPICILNQDDARNFHASDAKKKYTLFRKATNMDVQEVNYQKAQKNCSQAKSTLERKKQAFSELERELQQLKLKFDEMRSSDEVQALLRSLEDEYHWSEITELESTLKQTSKSHAKQTAKIDNLSGQLANLTEQDDTYKQKIKTINKKLQEVAIESASKDADFTSLSEKLQDLRNKWKTCHHELKRKKEQIARENSKVNDLAKEVSIATNVNLAEQRNSIMSKISETKEKHSEVLVRKGTTEHELTQTRNAINHEQSSVNSAAKKRDNFQNSLRQLKAQLNELNVRGKDNLAVYGKNMTDLVAAVKQAHAKGKFSEMPRGPIGSYLKVRDKKWSSALEHIIGNSMKTFCVNNEQDSRNLFNIMQKVYGNEPKPTITTSRFYDRVHDVSRKSVRAPAGTMASLNCLQIDDPIVANFLIDNIGMESILLVQTHDQATSLASNEDRVPVNCAKIVTLDQTEFYPTPNYRSYGGSGRQSRFLQVSTSDRKKQLQTELKSTGEELAEAEAAFTELQEQKYKLTRREGELHSTLERLLKGQNILEGKLSTLESSLRDMEGGYIKVLADELNQAREKLAVLQKDDKELTEQEQGLRDTTKNMEVKVKKMKEEKDTLHTTLYDDLTQEQLKLERNTAEINLTSQAISDEKDKLLDLQERMQRQKLIVQEKIQKAEQLCQRMDNTRQMTVIIAELKKVKVKLESLKQSGPSKQQVATSLIEKQNLHRTTSKMISQLSSLIVKLEKAVVFHWNSAIQLQALIGNRVQYCFQAILKMRGYMGSIEIEHERKALEIKCTGRDAAALRTASSTRSLSGGERSYATVAFIMALWDCMELPFYFLDEFDVFMDNVNRKTTMDLLIGHAEVNPHRQYVFLTPQDTSILVANDGIQIHKLADPEREVVA